MLPLINFFRINQPSLKASKLIYLACFQVSRKNILISFLNKSKI